MSDMRATIRSMPLVVFAVLAVLVGITLMMGRTKLVSPMVDKPLPDFSISSLQGGGKLFMPKNWQGQPILLNIFASWCEPCKAEHPFLMKIASERRIALYGIAWRDKPEKVSAYLTEMGNPFQQIGVDQYAGLTVTLGLTGVPESMLIDTQGKVRWKFPGPITQEVYDSELAPLIAQYGAAGR